MKSAIFVAFGALTSTLAISQPAGFATLEIDVDNFVCYNGDISDYARLATDPNITTRLPARNFANFRCIGDVIAVNGRPAKGTDVVWGEGINLTPGATSGQAIADVSRTRFIQQIFEIHQADAGAVGTFVAMGLTDGPPPPGGPAGTTYNVAIVGGTGAYLGTHGQIGPAFVGFRSASRTEDPGFRRTHGGGKIRYVAQFVPAYRPALAPGADGAAVLHSDFSPVTQANPARAGEVLILRVSGLGPTNPGLPAGESFPSNPLQEVNAPVEVTVDGSQAEVLVRVGWPGTRDVYRVDFRMPFGASSGTVAVQLAAAWINGPTISVPVR